MSNTWQSVETALFPIVSSINQYLSNYILVFLLLSVGIWYSIKTRFIQIRCFGEGMKKVFGNLSLNGKKHEQGMSSFQALATAIAAQVGTGNIVGASGAILTGGPGAIFWMWLIAFFGMATIYAEAVLAVDTRVIKEDGTVHGGPVYYITKAFSGGFGRFLAGFFAVAIILALGFMGCMVQSNSIGSTFQTAFGVPSWIIGIILVVICGFIFLGGVKRLAAVTEKLVPTMAGLFLLGALLVLIIRFRHIPETFGMIFRYAFQPQAIIGGGFGAAIKTAISQGAKRGLFSNEAGMGSTGEITAVIGKTNLAQTAFGTVFGSEAGPMFVAVCLFFFAFSTVLSWNMFGKINTIYLFGKKSTVVYTVIALVFIFLGTVSSSDLVWELTDLFNNLMVIPNVIALFALTKMVLTDAKKRMAPLRKE